MKMKQEDMFFSALKTLNEVVGISFDDEVLILHDIHCRSVADALNLAAASEGCKTISFLINENEHPLLEIPRKLCELLKGKTIVLNILKAFPEEISFRIKWI